MCERRVIGGAIAQATPSPVVVQIIQVSPAPLLYVCVCVYIYIYKALKGTCAAKQAGGGLWEPEGGERGGGGL